MARYRPIYEKLHRYNLRHLQFHLPDGRSLVRIHQPKKFGDSLLEIRPSVRRMIVEHKPIYGFEIGRYLGAYRSLYPLFYKGEYVGSVELSFTFKVMKKTLERVAGGESRYYLALNLAEVKRHADWSQLHAYRSCYVDDRFVVDEKIPDQCALMRQSDFHTDLLPYREFSRVLRHRDGYWVIAAFIPLRMIDGRYGGYYLVMQKDNGALASAFEMIFWMKVALAVALIVTLGLILLLHLYRRKAYAAEIDPLAKIYNRRGCMRRLNPRTRYALLFFDIDRFKEINDTYGHDKGDEVIRMLVDTARRNVRRGDVFCRFGGDEFLLFLREADEEAAVKVAEKLRHQIEATEIDEIGKVSVSIGVALPKEEREPIERLIARADRGLYRAKAKGRNRVERGDWQEAPRSSP